MPVGEVRPLMGFDFSNEAFVQRFGFWTNRDREVNNRTSTPLVRDESLDFRGIPAGQGLYSIHPYPAMLHFLLVRKFIKEFSSEGELVFDPFCGSGVSAVEAMLNGRNYVGYDINPLAVLIAKVRTTPISTEKAFKLLEAVLKQEVKDYEVPSFPNIEYLGLKGLKSVM
jgi:adenine specific DNA methylase Mod